MKSFPKIQDVRPLSNKRLLVTFRNNVRKVYDCLALLDDENFRPLLNDGLFKCVRADKHGYGVIWTDDLDLSESELWLNGVLADQSRLP